MYAEYFVEKHISITVQFGSFISNERATTLQKEKKTTKNKNSILDYIHLLSTNVFETENHCCMVFCVWPLLLILKERTGTQTQFTKYETEIEQKKVKINSVNPKIQSESRTTIAMSNSRFVGKLNNDQIKRMHKCEKTPKIKFHFSFSIFSLQSQPRKKIEN